MPIPRFNPGVPETDFTGITKFQPTGAQAEAELWGDMAKDMRKVSETFGEIETRRVIDEQEAAGKVAAANPNFDPMQLQQAAITSADRAFKKGMTGSYMAQLDIQKSQTFASINAESFEDPMMLRRRMEQYLDVTASKMPVDVAIDYKQGAMREVDAYYANSLSAAAGRARSQQKDDIMAGMELSERRLKELGAATDPAAQKEYALEAAKLKVRQEQAVQAGVVSPNQILVRNQVLKEDLEDGTLTAAVAAQPGAAKLDFAMSVVEGKSGTGLDLLPPDRRMKAVSIAQQMLNAEDAQQRLADRVKTVQATQAVWNASELVAANPTDPRARTVVSNLMALANTPETVEQVGKLRAFVNNPADPRFATSNKEYLDYLELEAARGELTQQQIDTAWGNDTATSRIGTADRQALSRLVQVKPKAIVGSGSWKTYVSKLETEFPVRERRRTGMSALFSQLGIDVPVNGQTGPTANGLTEGQMRANEGLIKQVLQQTQEKIAKGEIASEASLTEYAGKKIAEIRQYYGGASVDPNARPVAIPPARQGAQLMMQVQPALQDTYNRYKNDREGFARDAAAGKLDVRTINAVSRMLEGEK